MTATLECFFDCSSPWTYLAFENLLKLADEFAQPVDWRPILVGGVFNEVNPAIYAARDAPVPVKAVYTLKDLNDWARVSNLRIRFPPKVFPVNSVRAMRACLVLKPRGLLEPFARAAFKAYFSDDLDISQDDVLRELCREIGVEAGDVLAEISEPAVKTALKANTDELIARGGFGSPTMFVGGTDMYFGNDRLPLVRDALERQRQKGAAV